MKAYWWSQLCSLYGLSAVAASLYGCQEPLARAAHDGGSGFDAGAEQASLDSARPLLDAALQPWLDAEARADGSVGWEERAEPQVSWMAREVELEADGRSVPLRFELAALERPVFALRTYAADPDASRALCFQLEEVRAEKEWWVPRATSADYGDYCTRCAQRVAVGSSYGFFILPSGEAPVEDFRTLELRVALRDCLTLLPLSPTAPRPRSLVVESTSFAAPARADRILLPVVIATATPHTFTDGAQLEQVFARLREIWRSAGIELALHGPFELPRVAAPVMYSATERAPLHALARAARALARQANVASTAPWIVLTPCLVREDLLGKGSTQPLAMTAHLPGGFAVAEEPDGIFVAGERCGGLTLGSQYLDSETLAAVIAHELGHYLGLFHVREPDGREDTLADTSAETPNLMQSQPQASATRLTESQVALARRHLALAVAKRESSKEFE